MVGSTPLGIQRGEPRQGKGVCAGQAVQARHEGQREHGTAVAPGDPFGGQGAFITTAEFQGAAADVALEPGFPRISLVNGWQLVDLLIEHWGDILHEFQERLGLKPGLVRA